MWARLAWQAVCFGAQRLVGMRRLDSWVALHARRRPDREALVGDTRRWTWAELEFAVCQCAHRQRRAAGADGTMVVVGATDSAQALIEILGSLRAGLVPAVIPPGATATERMALEGQLAKVQAASLRGARFAKPTAVVAAMGTTKGDSSTRRGLSRATRRAQGWAALLASSGTTGMPKFAPISEERVAFSGHVLGLGVLQLSESDRVYCTLPVHHATGLVVAVASSVVAGATLVVRNRFSVRALADDIGAERITVLVYVAETLRWTLRQPAACNALGSLRAVIGTGCDQGLFGEMRQKAPKVAVHELYGATELPVALLNLDQEPGAVGRIPGPLRPRVRIVEVDQESGTPCVGPDGMFRDVAEGASGELLLSPLRFPFGNLGRFEGFLGPPEEPPEAQEPTSRLPGWLRTGDLAHMTARGHLFIDGRLGDVLRFRGHNTTVQQLESAVADVMGMRPHAAYPLCLDGIQGTPPALAVEGEPDWERLSHAVASLPYRLRPQFIRVLQSLPRGPTLRPRRQLLSGRGLEPGADGATLRILTPSGYLPLTTTRYDVWLRGTR
jgi:fatty-acyl-CoA synthase